MTSTTQSATNNTKKTALITGAGSGIGLECSKILAKMGYDLVISSNQKQLDAVAKELSDEFAVKVVPIFLDLAKDQAAHRLSDYCQKHNIQIDVLISNAGKLVFAEIDEMSDKKVENLINLHVQTPTMLCKLFGSAMKERGHGYIMLMSSLSTWMPYPKLMLYSATKRYLKDFGKALHYEMEDYGVGVTTICPGAVNTNFYKLSTKYRQLALRLRIMMNPDILAKKSIQKMFKKRVLYIPGVFNKLFLFPLFKLASMWFVQLIRHKFFPRKKIPAKNT